MADSLIHAHGILPNGYMLNGMGSDGAMRPLIGLNAQNQLQLSSPLAAVNQALTATTLLGTLVLPSGSVLLPIAINGVAYNITLTKV